MIRIFLCGPPGLMVDFPPAISESPPEIGESIQCFLCGFVYFLSTPTPTKKNPQIFGFWTFKIHGRLLTFSFVCVEGGMTEHCEPTVF